MTTECITAPAAPSPARKGRPLKLLSLAHSAVNRTSGRVRYEYIAESRDDIDLTLVAPDRWQEYGRQMPLDPHVGRMDFRTMPVRLPYVPRMGWYLHHYPGLSGLVRQMQPDVIHLWEEPWSLVALQAIWVRKRQQPKAAILLETDQNILRPLPPPFEQIRRYTLKHTDLLIGRQPESLEVARRCGYDGPTAIVEYGVAEVFRPGDRSAARAALDLAPDAFVIGYVGRIVPEKGLDDVLDAMVTCPVPITLLVLGSGPGQETFEARAQSLGLRERVRLFSPRPPTGVAEVINAMDALVLMSRTTRTWKEQFGRVIMEAQACGVPVIGSDSGSIPGVVASGGWIVKEGDGTGLAKLLAELAASPEACARAGAAGLAQASTRFKTATVANALADACLRAAKSRAGRMS